MNIIERSEKAQERFRHAGGTTGQLGRQAASATVEASPGGLDVDPTEGLVVKRTDRLRPSDEVAVHDGCGGVFEAWARCTECGETGRVRG